MAIGDNQVVTIEYTLKRSNGDVIESSDEKGPMTFRMGDERMLPGLAAVIRDMEVDEYKEGVIPAGELVPAANSARRRVPLSEFPADSHPNVGDRFEATEEHGQAVTLQVVSKGAEALEVAVLHPLHDEEIHYDVQVVAARQPPPIPGGKS